MGIPFITVAFQGIGPTAWLKAERLILQNQWLEVVGSRRGRYLKLV